MNILRVVRAIPLRCRSHASEGAPRGARRASAFSGKSFPWQRKQVWAQPQYTSARASKWTTRSQAGGVEELAQPTSSLSRVKAAWRKASSAGEPPCDRSSHGTSIVDGRLYVYGGENIARTPIDSVMHSVNLSGERSWQAAAPKEAPPPRVAHAQAAVDDFIYIFGGREGIEMQEKALNDLWCFDTKEETWTEIVTEAAPSARSFHQMIAVDRTLYLFGGCGTDGRLSDLHSFDTKTREWRRLPDSEDISGRGGASITVSSDGKSLLVIGGFAGEEKNDCHVFDFESGSWSMLDLVDADGNNMRPRSVCVAGTLPTSGVLVLFGGEVDPSAKGHEGAGGFAKDLVFVANTEKVNLATMPGTNDSPNNRGWSAGAVRSTGERDELWVFGGLTGDDASPTRLGDLWVCEISKS